ncbi:hypothetical protein DICVIV_02251 [Dictyocaulus viviparus]|uniref:Nucleotide-diphospho-sugar transferase domain-containing protein n=1 Tax=Dictyocaulus viviparus TaxID=29172 RepID=A0A0D8Y407_DICVI|nr:hypothetical protein DICVIV_02251 [Dictyocaulus viviparus]
MHNYPLRLVMGNEFTQYNLQSFKFVFRRHCIVSFILETTEWVLFMDADIGVVNPTRLIEEYMDTKYDITFYDRFCNWEVAIGSYIVRSSPFSRKFLLNFANFESQLPQSFHGTENGAFHAYILETIAPYESRNDAEVCYSIWEQSQNYDDLYLYEACIRLVLGSKRIFDKVQILRKGTAWVRDIWITGSQWSFDRDFMLHGMKESDRSMIPDGFFSKLRYIFKPRFTWYPPLTNDLDMTHCSTGDVKWQYDMRFQIPQSAIEKRLYVLSRQIERKRWRLLGQMKKFL